MVMRDMEERGMSGEKNTAQRLTELLAEEQTWTGRYHGHCGQARVAEREAEYWERRLEELGDDVEPFVSGKFKRNLRKARARAEYHKKQAEEAREKLERIRTEIKKIIGGDVE